MEIACLDLEGVLVPEIWIGFAEKTGIVESGYRVISNIGQHGHQEVPHLHMHVLGGAPIGRLVTGQ